MPGTDSSLYFTPSIHPKQSGSSPVTDISLLPLRQGGIYPLTISSSVPTATSASTTIRNTSSSKTLSEADCKVLALYAQFFLENPRIHIRVEAPQKVVAKEIHDALLAAKLRPDRLEYRGGTDISAPRLVITQY